ncbi:hypothetical protein L7F22_059020 [Adiantum nelumboides]|nr:hypothetical protein [Adiantum nelumboides]
MDPAKIEAIRNWPDLKNVHEVRSFLGLCSYYRRYVRNFAEIASPLHMLTQKGVPFSWGVSEVTAFQTLKDKMTTGPVLILPDLQKSFEVYCDACGRSLGAVLMQEGRVIAYESRMFSKPEMTAQIYEKELLAVIDALTQWRHYLLGPDFTVFTDHQSLRYFLSQKQLSEKQMRWANILSQFHFQIVHVQTQKNVVADALSRKPLVQAISAIHHSTFEDMVDQYATDTDFADIFTRIRDGETVAGYSLWEGYLMRKTMLCVTQPLRQKVMTECHCPPYTGHRGIATTMKGVERYFYWPRLKKDVEEFVRSCLVFQALRHHKLVINAKKSEFLPEIHLRGHIVSAAGVQMDPAKIEAIRNWPDLKNVHEVRSFLGLCSYYRRYVRKFAEIASLLHMLTQKGVPFSWEVTEIIKKNLVVSYKLELPPSWGRLHPTFHISWLKHYIQGDSPVPELSSYVPEIEDEHVILVREMILDVRQKETRKKLTTEFLVKWMDLDESDSTWQTDEEMQQYPNFLQEFFDKRQIFL